MLRRVDLFLLLQKDFSGYQKYYGIRADRVRFLPWKINLSETISTMKIEEGDYAFAGGLTHRDWATLANAMQGLSIPLIISIPNDNVLLTEGLTTILPDQRDFGPNTKIIRHDANPRSWLELVARSKFVVLPITADSLNPSGISTYLSIITLKKCCIISEGPSTKGILSSETSLVIPPNDAKALRKAILLVNSDDNLRHRLAEGGYTYAMSLGGVSRLHFDFIKEILKCLN